MIRLDLFHPCHPWPISSRDRLHFSLTEIAWRRYKPKVLTRKIAIAARVTVLPGQ